MGWKLAAAERESGGRDTEKSKRKACEHGGAETITALVLKKNSMPADSN
jgi:hypothetical protein